VKQSEQLAEMGVKGFPVFGVDLGKNPNQRVVALTRIIVIIITSLNQRIIERTKEEYR
jgi:hypothetical protein